MCVSEGGGRGLFVSERGGGEALCLSGVRKRLVCVRERLRFVSKW